MKWYFVLSIILIISFNNLFGQEFKDWGMMLGINNSYSSFETGFNKLIDKYKFKPGIITGVYTNFSMLRSLDLYFDLSVVQRGDYYEIKDEHNLAEYKLWEKKSLYYVALSPNVKFYLSNTNIKPYIFIGPTISLKIYGEGTYNDAVNKEVTSSFTEDLDTFNFDALLGAGIEIVSIGAVAEFRYYYGVNNVANKDWMDFKSRTIAFVVGKSLDVFSK